MTKKIVAIDKKIKIESERTSREHSKEEGHTKSLACYVHRDV
jgi:hypothetical protein